MGKDGKMLGDNFGQPEVTPEEAKSLEVTNFEALLEGALADKTLSKEEQADIIAVLTEAKEAQKEALEASLEARKGLILEGLVNSNVAIPLSTLQKLGIKRKELFEAKKLFTRKNGQKEVNETNEVKEKHSLEELIEMGMEKVKDVYNHGEFEIDYLGGIDFNDGAALFDIAIFDKLFLRDNVQSGITREDLVKALNEARLAKMQEDYTATPILAEEKAEAKPAPEAEAKPAPEAEAKPAPEAEAKPEIKVAKKAEKVNERKPAEAGEFHEIAKGEILWNLVQEAYPSLKTNAEIAKACNAVVMENADIKHLGVDSMPKDKDGNPIFDGILGDKIRIGDKLFFPALEDLVMQKIIKNKKKRSK